MACMIHVSDVERNSPGSELWIDYSHVHQLLYYLSRGLPGFWILFVILTSSSLLRFSSLTGRIGMTLFLVKWHPMIVALWFSLMLLRCCGCCDNAGNVVVTMTSVHCLSHFLIFGVAVAICVWRMPCCVISFCLMSSFMRSFIHVK